MENQTTLEQEVAALIIEAVNLEDIAPEAIAPDAPLYREGLGLDSIDMLEISLVISRTYGFKLRQDSADNTRIFASLRTLAAHIAANRTK